MKKHTLFLAIAILFSSALLAQKDKQKNKEKTKQETRNKVLGKDKSKTDVIWEGTRDHDGGGPKPSKNQPAKVKAAFARDYPQATQVSWSKYRGDWTATFTNGLIRSTAVYHANGERKDTRTVIAKPQLPRQILDEILKKKPQVQFGDIIRIELPQAVKNLFRIKTIEAGVPQFSIYDADGKEVSYDY